MRDPKRIFRICILLNKVWHKYPDMRFFQLLSYIGEEVYRDTNIRDFFFVEDIATERVLKKMLKNA